MSHVSFLHSHSPLTCQYHPIEFSQYIFRFLAHFSHIIISPTFFVFLAIYSHWQLLADEALKTREQRIADERAFEAECAHGVDFLKFVPNVRKMTERGSFLFVVHLYT